MRLTNKEPRLNEQIDEIEEMTSRQIAVLEKITDEKIAKLRKGDELPPGVIKLVKAPTSPLSVSFRWAIKWPAVTVTRA